MRLCVLGGTGFLGARAVECALERGHAVTLFTRGKTRAERFAGAPGLTHLFGDRDPEVGHGLDELAACVADGGLVFDAVLDISGYLPRHVRASAELLAPHTATYLFISSVSVYASPVPDGVDETGALIELDDPEVEEITPATYGGLKVICERVVRAACGDKALLVRPGIIAGPDDFTDRFSYWAWAADRAAGGELLAPGRPSDPTQVIDAADLGRWLIDLTERGAREVRRTTGYDTFNATGPRDMTIGAIVEASLRAADTRAKATWVPHGFLKSEAVAPFADMPLWVPPESGQAGMLTADSSRAYAAGLELRPLDETARTTWAWFRGELARRESHKPSTGLAPERAAEVLAAWRARQPSTS